MTTDNKTLADVQPGGRVRLLQAGQFDPELLWWLMDAASTLSEGGNESHAERLRSLHDVLSAQPSPGGQGDAVLRAINSKDLYQVLMDVQNGIDSPALASMANGAIQLIDKARSALAARQPVGEPVAWMTHHDEPMLFPTAAEAAAYCEDDEQPVPLFRSPAQAVDLDKLLALADRWATDRSYSGSPADDLRAWIDSQAVGK